MYVQLHLFCTTPPPTTCLCGDQGPPGPKTFFLRIKPWLEICINYSPIHWPFWPYNREDMQAKPTDSKVSAYTILPQVGHHEDIISWISSVHTVTRNKWRPSNKMFHFLLSKHVFFKVKLKEKNSCFLLKLSFSLL